MPKSYFFLWEKYQFKSKKVELTVLLSRNKELKKLNKKFRKKNKSTDVLSFPSEKRLNLKKNLYLGDIIISYEFMDRPKNLSKTDFKKKVSKIFIHGFLHLLNFDHVKNKDYKKMLKEEKLIYQAVISKMN